MAAADSVRCDDGHVLPVYRAVPKRDSRANIIVVQEIFGLTPHIRSVCDRLAERSYTAASALAGIVGSVWPKCSSTGQAGVEPRCASIFTA